MLRLSKWFFWLWSVRCASCHRHIGLHEVYGFPYLMCLECAAREGSGDVVSMA